MLAATLIAASVTFAAPPPGECGASCNGGGGSCRALTLYIENYQYADDPADYTEESPDGCWHYARVDPSDSPAYGTRCGYDPSASTKAGYWGADVDYTGGSNLIFDDTNPDPSVNQSLEATEVGWCADYLGSSILGEYLAPYSGDCGTNGICACGSSCWKRVTPSQGVSHYLPELYHGDPHVVDYSTNGLWNTWIDGTESGVTTSNSSGTFNLSPYVNNYGTNCLPGDPTDLCYNNYSDLEQQVEELCENTPTNGTLSIYSRYALATTPGAATDAEQALINAMNTCDPN